MTIPENILKELKCSLRSDGHYAYEPVVLKCGSNACKNCIKDAKDEKLKCYSCGDEHQKKDYSDFKINKVAKSVMKSFLEDLIQDLDTKLAATEESLKGNFIFSLFILYRGFIHVEEFIIDEMASKIKTIELEMDSKVDSLILQIQKTRDELRFRLDKHKERFIRQYDFFYHF